jgi:capsular exopolysaccharide synthesis family protein
LGIVLALLLDLFDKRFRYPEQATHELGLDILGTIPTIRRSRNGSTRIEDEAQLVEAFRGLRLNVRNAANGNGPVTLAISSPGPGDGKSLISSNLALAFAEAGYRTLLVDGDIRRGQLHSTFSVPQRPGLVDHLTGEVVVEDVIRETSHANLFVIPCGTRRHRGPELLAADATVKMVRTLRTRFDAVILDTAPLGAGIDPYALGAAAGTMLIVLRTGQTDRKLAQAKLTTLDRLPVRLIGAVLNDIQAEGMYKYYSYLDGYGTLDEDEEPRLVQAGGGGGSSLPAKRG